MNETETTFEQVKAMIRQRATRLCECGAFEWEQRDFPQEGLYFIFCGSCKRTLISVNYIR